MIRRTIFFSSQLVGAVLVPSSSFNPFSSGQGNQFSTGAGLEGVLSDIVIFQVLVSTQIFTQIDNARLFMNIMNNIVPSNQTILLPTSCPGLLFASVLGLFFYTRRLSFVNNTNRYHPFVSRPAPAQ
jgi:hypothetical protein